MQSCSVIYYAIIIMAEFSYILSETLDCINMLTVNLKNFGR